MNEEMEEMMELHQEEPAYEDLQQMLASDSENEDGMMKNRSLPGLPSQQSLIRRTTMLEEVIERCEEIDPTMDRSHKFKRGIEALTVPY